MNLSTSVKPVSYLKAHASEILNIVATERTPYLITQNGVGRVVIQDVESYQETQDALALLKMIGQSEKSIAEGKGIPAEKVFSELRAKLQAKRDRP